METPFWNEEEEGKGWVHRADRQAANHQRDPLLVFIHGLNGNGRGTWGKAPKLILEKLGIDLDVFTYDYPAGLFENADIEVAAQTLRTTLTKKFGDYRHLIFCVHSAGGLVTKAAIRQELQDAANGCAYRAMSFRAANSVTLRLRRIINLDVPHAGGRPLLIRIAKTFRGCLTLLIKLRLCGYNKLLDQLDPKGCEGNYVGALEKDYVELLRRLDALNLPRPTSIEVTAPDAGVIATHQREAVESKVWTRREEPTDKTKVWWRKDSRTGTAGTPRYFDTSAAQWRELLSVLDIGGAAVAVVSDARTVELRDIGHSIAAQGIKNKTDLATHIVSEFVQPWKKQDELRWGLVEIGTKLLHDFHLSQRFDRLVGEKALGRKTLEGISGSQAFIHRALVEQITRLVHLPCRLVLTGKLGVGKSILARHLGWCCSLDFLQAEKLGEPLPCVIPLERVTLDDPISPMKFSKEASCGGGWEVLGRNWCEYLAGHFAVDGAWGANTPENIATLTDHLWQMLEESIQSRPTLLILDGVDDFFSKNPHIRLDDFVAMVEALKRRAANNPRFTLVLGMRSSQPGKQLLASSAHTFTVRHLSLLEANALLPGFARWLARVEKEFRRRTGGGRASRRRASPWMRQVARENQEFYELLLTPFTLCQLGEEILQLNPAALQSRTQILDAILDAIVRRNHPDLERDLERNLITHEARKDMLMAVVWCFYRARQSEMTLRQVRTHLRYLTMRWVQKANRPAGEREPPQTLRSMRLARDARLESSLLSRTVFYPTSYAGYRFLHREWEDFLAGRYVAACVRDGRAQELGPLSCRQNMLRIAGELLGGVQITQDFVAPFLKPPTRREEDLIAGNFSAILGSSRSAMDGPAIRALVSSFDRIRGASPHVLLATTCWRVLRAGLRMKAGGHAAANFDPAARPLRAELQPLLNDLISGTRSEDAPHVTRSLAWCYLQEFHHVFGDLEPPPFATMAIDLSSPDPRTSTLICTQENPFDAFTYTEAQGSLQNAFLHIQPSIFLDASRPVSLVHYLYLISISVGMRAATSEVLAELPKFLAEGSDYESAVQQADRGILREVYRACRIVAGDTSSTHDRISDSLP